MTHPFRTSTFVLALAFMLFTGTGVFAGDQGPSREKAILDANPIAYWPLDENTTDHVVRDRSHHNSEGFYEGATAGAPGNGPGGRAGLFGIPGINLTGEVARVVRFCCSIPT